MLPSIENLKSQRQLSLIAAAEAQGFIAPRIIPLPIAMSKRLTGFSYLMVAAFPYGNEEDKLNDESKPALALAADHSDAVLIAAFARRNYYAEAVARLKLIAKADRQDFGGRQSDYRILCNSSIPEKPLAVTAGVGLPGRNSLIITEKAGSLVILAALAFSLPDKTTPLKKPVLATAVTKQPLEQSFTLCGTCRNCVEACPVGALNGQGFVDPDRCLQAYASSAKPVPPVIAAHWGQRLYGCTICQDVCPYNQRPIPGIAIQRGVLAPAIDGRRLIAMDDTGLGRYVAGTALGLAWMTPQILRRNAALALQWRANSNTVKMPSPTAGYRQSTGE